jgi:hypothetical protein
VARIEGSARNGALPDALLGQRLSGAAADPAAARAALSGRGANPLVVGAFADTP